MTTSFSTLPIVSLAALSRPPSVPALKALSARLDEVFQTTGFAYLVDLPLTFTHEDVFGLCEKFFGDGGENEGVGAKEKERLLKKTFRKENVNTYRGYFPVQTSSTNYKEGFEMGSPFYTTPLPPTFPAKFDLTEPNVWPTSDPIFSKTEKPKEQITFKFAMETLYMELQSLSVDLLSLLAKALGQRCSFFDHYFDDSLSTLRLIHYPPSPPSAASDAPLSSSPAATNLSQPAKKQEQEEDAEKINLICTPHTDSGILTLLHQDPTGGLEVLNAAGEWIPAPYMPGSLVVNIGDLMSMVSRGRWVATMHRVRRTSVQGEGKKGRYSVPFFCEPGAECVVRPAPEPVLSSSLLSNLASTAAAGLGAMMDEHENERGVIYGEHLLKKMEGWIEYEDVFEEEDEAIDGLQTGGGEAGVVAVAAS